jgi:hypothetical protein
LAEAWVSLREVERIDARSHALGACWPHTLAARADAQQASLHEAVESWPAELRYTAWAELVLALLAKDPGPTPWLGPAAQPSMAEFRAEVASLAEEAPAGAAEGLPRPLGRDVDFAPGGRRVLLAAADGETVGLDARQWYGSEPLRLRVRIGASGEPLGEILLGAAHADALLRFRQNAFGGVIAAWESRAVPPRRALRRPAQALAQDRWRDLEIRQVPRHEWTRPEQLEEGIAHVLLVQSGEYTATIPLPRGQEAGPTQPWLLQFRVQNGVMEAVGESLLVAALR